MISKKLIENAINEGVIRFCTDPNMESGTVCSIGNNWFYFGGLTAEESTPEEYINNVPLQDIVAEIYDTLKDFSEDEGYIDEYEYYEYVITYQNGHTRGDGTYKTLLLSNK